ncbi:MAG: protein kinase [Candidatus Binatia bacterium]
MAMVISRKYEVVGQLGQGGMGLVYKVRHTALDTILALKVLPAYLMENQDMVNRFYREARVMARLNHPNIVRVMDIERDENMNLHYFVMEYIEGKTLGKYARDKGSLSLSEIIEISRQVAEALAYAHNHNPSIIHRDIKPANIMIEDRSSRVVVMDFGIAKELGDGDSTKTGVVIGTLKYASPEQLRHEPLDGSADVYSLGMVIYEMYAGRQFFAGLDEHAVLGKVLYEPGENVPRFDRPPPPAFAELVTRAISKSRDRRYRNMQELLRALEDCRALESEADSTGTLVLPHARLEEPAKPQPAGEVDDIEARIRELEEERQRRLVLPLQTQAREARERAAQDGAAEWATTLFQQALAVEEDGARGLREREFVVAQEAFQEACRLFVQADDVARHERAKRRAEQAREEQLASKTEAEHYGARERARTFFTRGLALQAQADDLLEREDFTNAAQIYHDAARVFADARELAYRETIKEEVESARTQAASAKSGAEEDGASQFAEMLFREAAEHEERARLAISHEEFTQARELFYSASQKYQHAQEEARLERQHQEAVTAQQQVQEAKGRADTMQAKTYAPEAYGQAVACQQQGETHLRARAYEQATATYIQARDGYEHATQEARFAQEKGATATVRQHLEEAQTQAERAGVALRLVDSYAQVQSIVEAGHEYEQQQRYAEARTSYEEATQRFQQLTREVVRLVAQEKAEDARRQVTETVQGSEALKNLAKAGWAKARDQEQRADLAYAKHEYDRAAELYEETARLYIQARQDAERERLRQEATEAQRKMQAARTQAEQRNAARLAPDLFKKGDAAQKEAERRKGGQVSEQTIRSYEQAIALFTQAAAAAQREHSHQEATTARQRADDARGAADSAGAAQRFAHNFAQATQLVEQGDAEFARQNFAEASGLYEQAMLQWQRLQTEAIAQAEQERAEAARAQMSVAQQELAALKEWGGAKFTEAQKYEAEADAAWKSKRYRQAAEIYARAARTYDEARYEAEDERERRQALAAQQKSDAARAAAERVESSRYADALYTKALKDQQQAEQQLSARQWADAARRFTQVAAAFEQVQQMALQEKSRQETATARQRCETAYMAAEQAEVRDRCAEEFAHAQRLMDEAQRAETQQEFSRATQLYIDAAQQLVRLQREAGLQVARDEAEAACQKMWRVKETAAVLQQWGQAAWDVAVAQEAEADRLFQAQEYEDAAVRYAQAAHAYTTAAETGEREQLRQETQQAEREALAQKTTAEHAEAAHYAGDLFRQATTSLADAACFVQQQQFREAAQCYRRAQEQFALAEAKAQQERSKQAAQEAQQRSEESRATAEQAGAAQQFPQEFAEAQQLFTQAEAATQQHDFPRAQQYYERAQAEFVRLVHEVQKQLARAQAEAARKQLAQVKEHATVLAPTFAAKLWKDGQRYEAAGDQAWQAQAYDQAQQCYAQATQGYVQARIEAEEEQRRQRVTKANQEAARCQAEAEADQAQRYASDLYRQGCDATQQAEQLLATQAFDDAVMQFVQAAQFFTEARQQAHKARAQRLAEEAQEKARIAQTDAETVKVAELVPGQYAEVVALVRTAEQALSQGRLDEAQSDFSSAAVRFQQLQHDAKLIQQKLDAEAVRNRVHELRQHAQTAKGRQKRQAEKAATNADHLFQQGRYPQAQAAYEAALPLFVALHLQPTQKEDATVVAPDTTVITPREKRQEALPTSPAPQKSFSFAGGVAALAAAAGIVLYLSGAFSGPPPTPSIEKNPQTVKLPTNEISPPPVKEPEPPITKTSTGVSQPETNIAPPVSEKVVEPPPPVKEPEPPPQQVAKVTPPPEPSLPALEPPIMTEISPKVTGEVSVAEGERLAFAVEAESTQPKLLKFLWTLDGKKQAEGKKWTYKPGYEDGGDRPHEVKAIVSDGKNPPREQTWKVRVKDVNRPPVLANASPKAGSVQVSAGETQEFTVQASDPDREDRLVYVWSVDGQEMTRGSDRSWRLPASTTDASHTVTVQVIDKGNERVQVAWNVKTKAVAQPPRFVDVAPNTPKISTESGNPLDFTATAELVGGSATSRKSLSYLWRVNDGRPQKSESGQFRFAETKPGSYELSVTAVSPEGLQSSPRRWTIEVKPVVAAIPPPPPPAIAKNISSQEATTWLQTTYRQAWEQKNVDMLVQIGAISTGDAAKLRNILAQYADFRVAIKDISVRNDGSRTIATFVRVDTIDGKTLQHPSQQIVLERSDGGRIALKQ